jgi:ribonuclease HII
MTKKQLYLGGMLQAYYQQGQLEAGCDEAGRGCIAGPVCAAAVILPNDFYHPLLNDSKKVTEENRLILRAYIEQHATSFGVAFVSHTEIDKINILQASFRAMHKAVRKLSTKPSHLLIDGNRFKPMRGFSHTCVVKGDSMYASIAAASILAKTYRDEYMLRLHKKNPVYNWKTNKGYPTVAHREVIRTAGLSAYHRLSFTCLPNEEE